MKRIDWSSALVMSGSGVMAALIPGLFAFRIYGHHLFGLAREIAPSLFG